MAAPKLGCFHCWIPSEGSERGEATRRGNSAESESDEERGNGGCGDSGTEDKERGSKTTETEDSQKKRVVISKGGGENEVNR